MVSLFKKRNLEKLTEESEICQICHDRFPDSEVEFPCTHLEKKYHHPICRPCLENYVMNVDSLSLFQCPTCSHLMEEKYRKMRRGHILTYYDQEKQCLKEDCHYNDEGILDGNYIRYHRADRPSMRCSYKNGKIDGVCEIWYDNNVLAKRIHYRNGILHGKFRYWDWEGKIFIKSTYEEGRLVESEIKNS